MTTGIERAIGAALWLAAIAALAGCECSEDEPRARPAERRAASAGGEEGESSSHGAAIALRAPGPDVPHPSRFEVIDPIEAIGARRARGWASVEDLRSGSTARLSLGNWLCRLWTHYGAPAEVQRDGFVYAFRDRETGDVISAYSAGSGPALGGVIHGEDGLPIAGAQQRVAESVNALAALLDATVPEPCSLELPADHGAIRVGVRDGEWFEESVE